MPIDPWSCVSCIYTDCVKPVTGPSVQRCQEALSKRLGAFLFLEGNYRSLIKEKEDLAGEADKLQILMNAVKNKQYECHQNIEDLRSRIKSLLDENIPATTESLASISRCLCRCTPNVIRRYKIGREISKDLAEVRKLRELVKETDEEKIGYKPLAGAVEEQDATWTVGMTPKLDELKTYVHSDYCHVIGIHGKGGIGKSTLLKGFNNEFLKGNCGFDVVIHLVISNSKDLDVPGIQKQISTRINLPWDESQKTDERAIALRNALKRKSFMVLLDDVWQKFELQEIGIPQPGESSKSKVIMAARSLDALGLMGANKYLIEVKPLEPPEDWQLFKNNLTDGAAKAIESPSVKPYAVKIVNLCKGLPLALKVIGMALGNLTSREDWKEASETIKDSLRLRKDMKEPLLVKLQISYTRLDPQYPSLKPCFLYCSLFPKDYSIQEDQLVEYWMAEGFLGDVRQLSLENVYINGYHIVRMLKNANLLETGDMKSEVKMHDIIREMALWIADGRGEKKAFLVKESAGKTKAAIAKEWSAAERISFMNTTIQEIHDSLECNALLTLLLKNNPKLHKLPGQFFRFMPLLRVLDLSYTRIKELPIEDGALPKLELLNLRNTRIRELPKALGSLTQLLHLDLSRTYSLVTIPAGVIAGLSALQVLNIYCSRYGRWTVDEENRETGVQLTELTGLEVLEALGITVQSMPVLEKFFIDRGLNESARYIRIEYCEGLQFILISKFRAMTQLKELSVHSCYELREIVLDEIEHDGIEEKPRLEVLTLAVLSKLQSISWGFKPNSYLRNLRELNISSCPKLENLNWVLQLSSLERLLISDCEEIKQIIEEKIETEVQNIYSFSILETISLKDLPKLEIISRPRAFPALKTVSVQGCPNLLKLPFGPNYDAKNLQKS